MQKKKYTKLQIFMLFAIILVTMNLRGPITSIGPLMEFISLSLGSSAAAGFLTTLVLILYSIGSPLALRTNYMKMVFVSILLIFIGILVRSYGDRFMNLVISMYLGTILFGFGAAFSNVIMPAIIKKYFPKHLGFATGIYGATLQFSAFFGAFISLPLSLKLDWQNALAIWAIIAFIALIVWIRLIRLRRLRQPLVLPKIKSDSNLYKNKDVWIIMIFIGLQSLMFYNIMSWLPLIIKEIGFDLHFGASVNSITQGLSIVCCLFLPKIVANSTKIVRRNIVLTLIIMYILALIILFFEIKSYFLIFIVSALLSAPMGGLFGITILFISLVSKDVKTSLIVSGFSQFGGYLLGAGGPVIIGILKDVYHNFTPGIIFCLIVCLLLFFFGLKITNINKI